MTGKSKGITAGDAAGPVKPDFPGIEPYSWILPVVIILAVGIIAFANSFGGAFILDDKKDIIGNPNIRSLLDAWHSGGSNTITRPLIQFSFAVNYALGGLDPWGYHLFNLSIHLLSALTLFGIVRRTLCLPALRGQFSEASRTISLAVALIWTVHPLQTQAVTYICQRYESVMGFFYLLTLYCFIRGFLSPNRRASWYSLSVFSCTMGMLAKEVIVTAPLACLLYDYLFFSGSLREALRRRTALYAGLTFSWVILILNLSADYSLYASILSGATGAMSPWRYLLTQFGVITHYLRLAVWPRGLVLDYGWPPAETAAQILPYALLILSLFAATVWAVRRRQSVGFLGGWFFLPLSLTSSVFPTLNPAFEHRMYLSLAAVVSLLVIGFYIAGSMVVDRLGILRSMARRKPLASVGSGGLLVAVVVMLGSLTVLRNSDYQSDFSIWSDTVRKRPENARAQGNLGISLWRMGKPQEAIRHLEESLKLLPNNAQMHNNLGIVLIELGKPQEALTHYQKSLQIRPDNAKTHNNIGILLLDILGKPQEAIRHFEVSLGLKPYYPETHNNLGVALYRVGRFQEALRHYHESLRLRPDDAETHGNLGVVLAELGKTQEALTHYRKALSLQPGNPMVKKNLARLLEQLAGRQGNGKNDNY